VSIRSFASGCSPTAGQFYSYEMVRRVAADERFDRTQFRSEVEYLDHVVQLAAYRCPHCGKGVEFQSRHFGPGVPRATVDPRWRSAFDAARPLGTLEAALEFHCPGCTAPVRIIYAEKGDQYRIFDADLLEVLEVADWPEPAPQGSLD
jgi:predicted RNA-binding Zn-ribbon protein involved in translation (DUF1610 family)